MRECTCPEEVKPELGYTHLPRCPQYQTQYQRMYPGASCRDTGFCTAVSACKSPADCLDDRAFPGTQLFREAMERDRDNEPEPVESVDHPAHYGGDTAYEVIKVLEAWGLDTDAYLFNVVKYIGRPGKGNYLEDLKKARWYLDRKIARMEGRK